MIKLKNLITELDFKTQGAFNAYSRDHKIQPDTKVTVAGKEMAASDAKKAGDKGPGFFKKLKQGIFGKSEKDKKQDSDDEWEARDVARSEKKRKDQEAKDSEQSEKLAKFDSPEKLNAALQKGSVELDFNSFERRKFSSSDNQGGVQATSDLLDNADDALRQAFPDDYDDDPTEGMSENPETTAWGGESYMSIKKPGSRAIDTMVSPRGEILKRTEQTNQYGEPEFVSVGRIGDDPKAMAKTFARNSAAANKEAGERAAKRAKKKRQQAADKEVEKSTKKSDKKDSDQDDKNTILDEKNIKDIE